MTAPKRPAGPDPHGRVGTVRARYAGAAADYDELIAPTLAPAHRELVAALPRGARVVVDVGAGTGRMLPALRAAAPRAVVVAVDLSEDMLRAAAGTAGGALAAMDACRLALRNACADAAVTAFTLMLVPEPAVALAEIARVLRPGGWLGVAVWGRKQLPAADVLGDELDRLEAPDDPLPAERSDEAMNAPPKLEALLRTAGFADCRARIHRVERPVGPDELLRSATRLGTAARRLAVLPRARASQAVDRARRRLADLPPDDLVDRSEVVLATARRPA